MKTTLLISSLSLLACTGAFAQTVSPNYSQANGDAVAAVAAGPVARPDLGYQAPRPVARHHSAAGRNHN